MNRTAFRVWMVDPSANTPYYDIELALALQKHGIQTKLLTSRFIYQDIDVQDQTVVDYFFFKPLDAYRQPLRQRSKLRQVSKMLLYPFDLLRLYQQFKIAPPDILHVQWTYLPLFDWRLFATMAKRTPLILTVHNPLVREARFARLTDMSLLYPIASRIIVHSERNAQMLLERAPITKGKIDVIPMGAFDYGAKKVTRDEARYKLNIPQEAKVVLFFGIIKPYKGLMDLIEAVAVLARSHPDIHLLVAGAAQESMDGYYKRLAQYNLLSNTTLRTSFIPDEEIKTIFQASDVICLPYQEASQSAVLLTAFGHGMPVVVTDVGGLPDVVEDGKNGYIVPPHNPKALAEALEKILDNAELREAFSKRSAEIAKSRYTWTEAARLTEQVYQQVLHS